MKNNEFKINNHVILAHGGDKKAKVVVVSGNFKFITLRFSARLKGPLMKLVSTLKLY